MGLDVGDGEDPVLAILGVRSEFGFVEDAADVEDAVRWIERRERRRWRRLRAAVRVIRDLREA